MTELENKLIQLGYETLGYYHSKDVHYKTNSFTLVIVTDSCNQSIERYYLYPSDKMLSISSKDDLKLFKNGLQQAFNQLQSDLEVLKQ